MSVRHMDEVHRKTLSKLGEGLLQELKESRPDLYEKIIAESKRLVEKYGVPSFQGSFGGLWMEDCPSHVTKLLGLSDRYGRPLRIIVEPELFDGDAHHWAVSYEWLEWDDHRGWIPLRELEQQDKKE